MCRHLVYLGEPVTLAEVLTAAPHSLYRQSWAPRFQRHGTVNADGFGVGWYPERRSPVHRCADGAAQAAQAAAEAQPARYRRAVPIWSDDNLPELSRVTRTGAVLAAVRSATDGTGRDECAAAPFRDGAWLFSHNGAIRDWRALPEEIDLGLGPADLLSLESSCDSALLWAAVKKRLRRGEAAQDALGSVTRQIAAVRPGARLNLLLTDGRTVAATRRGDTLWYRETQGRLALASEPDDESEGWCEIPEDTIAYGDRDGICIEGLNMPADASQEQNQSSNRGSNPESGQCSYHGSYQGSIAVSPGDHGGRFTLEQRLPPDYFATRLREDVLNGLSTPPRSLPPKWFYDARGSELFEQITRLPEYYLTRAEQQILTRHAAQIAQRTAAGTLVELGAGSSRKTRLLLDALAAAGTLERYAPLDVSASALSEAGEALCLDYPALQVTATVTDFEAELALPVSARPRLVAFLGSTIGNFDPPRRRAFFAALRAVMDTRDTLLLGADLVKDPGVLWRAYNDGRGVTAAFNKNVLQVLNRRLDADFDLDAFDHEAVWNEARERIEMRLQSRLAQTVKVRALDLTLDFARDEHILTEISTKFRRESLTEELARAGFTLRQWWTDSAHRFVVLLAAPAVR